MSFIVLWYAKGENSLHQEMSNQDEHLDIPEENVVNTSFMNKKKGFLQDGECVRTLRGISSIFNAVRAKRNFNEFMSKFYYVLKLDDRLWNVHIPLLSRPAIWEVVSWNEISSYITIISVSLHSCHFGVIAKVFAPFGRQVDVIEIWRESWMQLGDIERKDLSQYGDCFPYLLCSILSISPAKAILIASLWDG